MSRIVVSHSTSFLFIITLIITLLSTTSYAAAVESFCTPSKGYESLLDEQFNQDALDRNVWNTVQTDNRFDYDFACGRTALCAPHNVRLDNGTAVFHLKSESMPSPTNDTKTFKYTTAGMHTRDKLVIRPTETSTTRICIRAKLPSGTFIDVDGKKYDTGTGLWPAFWTMTNDARNQIPPKAFLSEISQTESLSTLKTPLSVLSNDLDDDQYDPEPDGFYSCNPDGGEMDILERYNTADKFEATYHFQRGIDGKTGFCQYPTNHGAVTASVNTTFIDTWHEWAIERGPDYIKYVFDNEEKFIWKTTDTIPNKNYSMILNNTAPYFLYLNLAFGGFGGSATILDEYFPQDGFKLELDYVKVLHADNERNKSLLIIVIAAGVGALAVLVIGLILKETLSKAKNRDELQEDLLSYEQTLSAN